MKRGFRFFDAPLAIIISTDRSLEGNWISVFDIGCVAQNICLIANRYGLGTCIERQGVSFSEIIRKHTGLPESKVVIIGIAMGYPDWQFAANNLQTEREPINNITHWVGF